jgi:hypothetical protein
VGGRGLLLREVSRLQGVALEARGKPYAVMVPKTNAAVPLKGRKKKNIERYVQRLPKDAFSEVRPAR